MSVLRRTLLGMGAAAIPAAAAGKLVRIGIIGTGNRGTSLLSTLLHVPGVAVPALCDLDRNKLAQAQDKIQTAGHAKPEVYTGNEEAYRNLLGRDDLDGVIIATPWDRHARMAVDAMKAGKYAAVEVPAAITLEECWDLVDTSEATGKPCMMLENWSFRRDNLAILNMIRQGLFGTLVHCHCAHSHDCIDHWFFDKTGRMRWSAEFLLKRNADQYPTHSLGPVLSWMDINCGDAFSTIASTATRSLGINNYFRKTFGPDHPNATRRGDIVTSIVRTNQGNTIVINYDMQLPRPYDNRWMIQGTEGIYSEERNSIYLWKRSPRYHEWEPFPPYQDKYEHRWWKPGDDGRLAGAGHGGTDYLELREFVAAVRQGAQTPIDVYDSVTMSAVIPLSEQSIARESVPVPFPDFTRGGWKTRKPYFAV